MKKQALALIFGNGVNFLVNFAMSPFLARSLSYEDNGTYGQVNLINSYLVILLSLGINFVVNIFLVENKEKEKRVANDIFWVQIFMGLVGILFVIICGEYIAQIFKNPDLFEYLLFFLPTTISMIQITTMNNYFIYFKKTVLMAYSTVILNVVKIIVVFVAINYYHSLWLVFASINILSIIQCLYYYWIFRNLQFPISAPNYSRIRHILNISYPYLILSAIGYLIMAGNGVIISNMLGVKDFAIYRNGAMELPFISSLYLSVTSVFLPTITTLTKENKIQELITLKQKISNAVAYMVYPITFFTIANGSTFISTYLGEKYISSGVIFSIYNIAVLIRINSYTDILTARKKPLKIIIPHLVTFIINAVLAIFLILQYNILGAALAYVISILFYSVLQIYHVTSEIGIPFRAYFDFKNLFYTALICAILSLVSYWLIAGSFKNFIVIGMLYVSAVYYLLLKLNLVERTMLPGRIQTLLSKLRI